jgi:hypothetical protein
VVILSGTLDAINLMFGSMAGSAGFIIVYFLLFILAQLFSTAMVTDAWVSKNTMQVVAIALFNIFTCVYSVVQVLHLRRVYNCGMEYITTNTVENSVLLAYKLSQPSLLCPKTDAYIMDGPPGTIIFVDGKSLAIEHSVSNIEAGSMRIQQGIDKINALIPVAAVIAGLCILYSIIGIFTCFKVYQEYGWRLIHQNGASLHKMKLLKRFHLFILLMKLNVFFSCGIIIQMVGAVFYYYKQALVDLNTAPPSRSFVISTCAIMTVVAIFYYAVGWFAVKRSSYVLMTGFFLLMIGESIGLVYAIIIASTELAFRITIIWLTGFAVVQIFLIVTTISTAFFLMIDFKDGDLHDICKTCILNVSKSSFI